MNLDTKNTNSTLFLLPTLGLVKQELTWFGFIDAFIGDVNHEKYDQGLYLLFKPSKLDAEFNLWIDKHRKRLDFIEDYDVDKGLVMLVFKLPVKYINDYTLFQEGKYSLFSKEFKELFPMTKDKLDGRNNVLAKEYTLYYHIFNKTDWLKKVWVDRLGLESVSSEFELWDKPNPDREIFDIKLHKQIKKKKK